MAAKWCGQVTPTCQVPWPPIDVVEAVRTDVDGKFHFTGIAVNIRIQLKVTNENGLPRYVLPDNDRWFEPGEVRENEVLHDADLLIAATLAEYAQLQWLYKADTSKIVVIPPGVELSRFYPIQKDEAKEF